MELVRSDKWSGKLLNKRPVEEKPDLHNGDARLDQGANCNLGTGKYPGAGLRYRNLRRCPEKARGSGKRSSGRSKILFCPFLNGRFPICELRVGIRIERGGTCRIAPVNIIKDRVWLPAQELFPAKDRL